MTPGLRTDHDLLQAPGRWEQAAESLDVHVQAAQVAGGSCSAAAWGPEGPRVGAQRRRNGQQ